MSKYDQMITSNRERSDGKITAAKTAILKLMDDGERVSVPKLIQMTGLSRGFFYKNTEVRKAIDDAMERQAGAIDPRRNILDQAMDSRIVLLQQQLSKLQSENETLKKENQKLHKALNKKNLNFISSL